MGTGRGTRAWTIGTGNGIGCRCVRAEAWAGFSCEYRLVDVCSRNKDRLDTAVCDGSEDLCPCSKWRGRIGLERGDSRDTVPLRSEVEIILHPNGRTRGKRDKGDD